MREIFVIDTSALIDYHDSLFTQNCRLSVGAQRLIATALITSDTGVALSIPSIVFIEIYRKWLKNEEFARSFYYEVYRRCADSPNVEIRSIEQEVLENLVLIRGSLARHEIHDKLILASAMVLKCPLITLDPKIADYVRETGVIPNTIM